MGSLTKLQFDTVVVGAGPAGIAAATTAAECGLRVGMVDDNRRPGGQIWRGETIDHAPEAKPWARRLGASGVASISGARIFAQPQANVLLAEQDDDLLELHYNKLILATGARERFLPFPGWTLPNVVGAGGLQALVKAGLPIEGKRVVVAGTGPLLLAVASYLRQYGAKVLAVCEQRPWADLTRFGLGLLRQPQKIQQALALRKDLSGIPFLPNCWPIEAAGKDVLEKVVLQRGEKTQTFNCDYLACGFHLVANTELAELLGCQIKEGFVIVDNFQQTSQPNVFCAGEPTGIGGLDLAIVEGQIAGFGAANKTDAATKLFGQRKQMNNFAHLLERTFALRPELRKLALAQTIVCRCEDVSYAQMSSYASWRAAKLHTRCGMGPCQGRICGPATKFLFNWTPDSVRPPIFPASLNSLSEGFSQFQPSPVTGEYA